MSRILCDLDGVLANSTEPWLSQYRAITGDPLHPHQLKRYDFAALAKHPAQIWNALATSDAFRKAEPYPQAVAGLRHLAAKHAVYIATYSHERVLDGHRQKIDWCQHYLPFLTEDCIIFTKHKWLISGDVLIEDSPANVKLWLEHNPYGVAYLVDAPYNRGYNNDRCIRVKTLMDVVTHLQGGAHT